MVQSFHSAKMVRFSIILNCSRIQVPLSLQNEDFLCTRNYCNCVFPAGTGETPTYKRSHGSDASQLFPFHVSAKRASAPGIYLFASEAPHLT